MLDRGGITAQRPKAGVATGRVVQATLYRRLTMPSLFDVRPRAPQMHFLIDLPVKTLAPYQEGRLVRVQIHEQDFHDGSGGV